MVLKLIWIQVLLWNYVLSATQHIELYGNIKALNDLPDRLSWSSMQNNQPLNNTRLISKDKFNAPLTIPSVDYMGHPVVVLPPGETVNPIKNPLNGDRILQNSGLSKPELYKGSSKIKSNSLNNLSDNSDSNPMTVQKTILKKKNIRRKFQPHSRYSSLIDTIVNENYGKNGRNVHRVSSREPLLSSQPPNFKKNPIVVYPENNAKKITSEDRSIEEDPTYDQLPPLIYLTPSSKLIKSPGVKPIYQSIPIVVEDSTYEPQLPIVDFPSLPQHIKAPEIEQISPSTPIVVEDSTFEQQSPIVAEDTTFEQHQSSIIDSPSAPQLIKIPDTDQITQATPSEVSTFEQQPSIIDLPSPPQFIKSPETDTIYQSTPIVVEDSTQKQSLPVDLPPPPQLINSAKTEEIFQSTPLKVEVSTYSPEKHYCGDEQSSSVPQIASSTDSHKNYNGLYQQFVQQPLFPLPQIKPTSVSTATVNDKNDKIAKPEPFDDRKNFKPLSPINSVQSAIKTPQFEYAPYYFLPKQLASVEKPVRPLITIPPSHEIVREPYPPPLPAPYQLGYEHLVQRALGGYSYQYFDRNPHLSSWAKVSPKPISFMVLHPVSRPIKTLYKPIEHTRIEAVHISSPALLPIVSGPTKETLQPTRQPIIPPKLIPNNCVV